MLSLDYTFMTSPSVANGFTADDLTSAAASLRDAHQKTMARHARGELGFLDLPTGRRLPGGGARRTAATACARQYRPHDRGRAPFEAGPPERELADWFVQLWAESLGKTRRDGSHAGPTPIGALGTRGLLLLFEMATAIAGELYTVNAFDQPGVELAKRDTYALMGRAGFEDVAQEWQTLPRSDARYTIQE